MKVGEIMTRDVEVIHPQSTLAEAAAKMRQLDIGPLPVSDGTNVVGMVTDRDITVRATADGRDPKTTKVQEVMTPEVVSVREDQDIKDAAHLMAEKQIRRLVVLNRDKRLVGIVSLGDLAVEEADDTLSGKTLESISEPAMPNR